MASAAIAGSNSRSRSARPTRADRVQIAARGTWQTQRAIFGPVQSPPSSGGVLIRSLRAANASGVRIVGLVPLWIRWSAKRLGTALVVAFDQRPHPAR